MYQEWIHAEKRRYYRAFTETDLLGNMVVVQDYGSMDTARGGRLTRIAKDSEDADKVLRSIGKIRLRHGYTPRFNDQQQDQILPCRYTA